MDMTASDQELQPDPAGVLLVKGSTLSCVRPQVTHVDDVGAFVS